MCVAVACGMRACLRHRRARRRRRLSEPGSASAHSIPGAGVRRERLLLVGLASCDEAIARRMMAAGRMPNLAGLKAAGAWGRLLAGEPHVGPASWTTLATGCHPETHGVLDAAMVRADGGGVSQAGLAAWQAPALWQAVAAAGRRTLTVGWPAAWPATGWPEAGLTSTSMLGLPCRTALTSTPG